MEFYKSFAGLAPDEPIDEDDEVPPLVTPEMEEEIKKIGEEAAFASIGQFFVSYVKRKMASGETFTPEELKELQDYFFSDDAEEVIDYSSRRSSNLPTEPDAYVALSQYLTRTQSKFNLIVRCIFSIIMLLMFALVIYKGIVALVALTFILQILCYNEITNVGFNAYKINEFPQMRTLSYYFLFTANFYYYGEEFFQYLGTVLPNDFLIDSHPFLTFVFYISGLMYFIFSLTDGNFMIQYNTFAWIHIGLLAVVTQSYFFIQNLYNGIIWYVVPALLIICNDSFAYICGILYGKTPLIKISPKKTWEGYWGAAFFTILLGLMAPSLFCEYEHFVCPFSSKELENFNCSGCVIPRVFQYDKYDVFLPFYSASSFLQWQGYLGSFYIYPFHLHCFVMSLFASIIAPFGGFFASGFKRALNIKDFSDNIPGHGGVVDRFDCQFLMATFVYVYMKSFVLPFQQDEIDMLFEPCY